MEQRVERALLAKVGTLVLAGAILLPSSLSSASTPARSAAGLVVDASINALALSAEPADLSRVRYAAIDALEIRSLLVPRTAIAATVGGDRSAIAPATAHPAPAPTPPPEPLTTNGIVLASWYGPGFFGNRTACGQTFTEEIVGVAHRTLPCGTKIQITSPAGATLVVPVIDRGPFVAGRSLDLSYAAKTALACSDLCTVRILVVD